MPCENIVITVTEIVENISIVVNENLQPISIVVNDFSISNILSNDVGNSAVLGTDGKIFVPESGVSVHNDLTGLNDGDYKHLTALEKTKFDNLPNTFVSNHSDLMLNDGTNPHGTTKNDVGLSNVDNTSDLSKPISTSTQSALDLKENSSNKVITVIGNETSNILFGSIKSIVDWVTSLFVPKTRTININGTSQDLSEDRTFNITESNSTPKGYLYNKSSWSDLLDFNTYGNTTASISSNKIIIGTTSAGSFGDALALKTATGLNKWKMTLELQVVNAPASTTYGLGIGIKSINTYQKYQTLARLDMTNAASKGDVRIDYGGNPPYTNAVLNTSSFAFTTGDVLRFALEQDIDKLTMTVFNLNTNAVKITTYTYVPSRSQPFPSNAGEFAIHIFGGSYQINSFKVETICLENAKLMCVGDSKTNGFIGTTFKTSFPQQLDDLFKGGIVNNSGGSDRTNEVLLKIPEIILMHPKRVLLNIGSNDKRSGASFASWSTNYSNIVTQLTTAGIEVFHLLQLNESSLNFTDYNNYINSTYSSDHIVDAGFIPLESSGVHPTQSAMDQIYMAIVSKIGSQIK